MPKAKRLNLSEQDERAAKMLAARRGQTLAAFLTAIIRDVLEAARKQGELPKGA